MFGKLLGSKTRFAGLSARNNISRKRHILAFEVLEDRRLLSLTPTNTALSASAATLLSGQTETLTATVSASSGTPTGGTVTFLHGNTTLGTATLNSGTATLQVSTLPMGTDVLMANYGGSGSFAASSTVVGPNSVITTVAGNGYTNLGVGGYSGDGGQATAAELNDPSGVAVDATGDLFIADALNYRIREVNHATGVITTVAGNGTYGYSGDGGQATAAELYDPDGLALNAAGDLFIADSANDRIREVDLSTGIITTVAGNGYGNGGDGGPATAATMDSPEGIAIDAAGDLFIADTDNYRIREVNHLTGVITTVAGTGTAGYSGDNGQATAAKLNEPADVAVDAAGDLFIADEGNRRIREVNASTQVITTVAGNGTNGYSGDNGPATAAELENTFGLAVDTAGNLFLPDFTNHRTREVNLTTGIIITVAGGGSPVTGNGDGGPATAAELDLPVAVGLDAAGDLFIADEGNERIRELTSGATVVTVTDPWLFAGKGAFNGPGTTDLLWFNEATGAVEAWKMSNGAVTGGLSFGTADPSQWKLLGSGDFEGNGTDDILWQNQNTGLVGAWLISNGAVTGWAALGPADLSQWQFAGIGKFKGSSNPADVLWFNQTTGYVVTWIIQNAAVTSGPVLGTADPSQWKVVGVGNFEDNGTDDILWQNQSTGVVGAWVISNAAVTGWDNLGSADPSTWKLVAVGDLGNGTPDLVWQNQSTDFVGAWIINNGAVTGWAGLGPADPSQWQVLGAGNLTGHSSGTGDVLWRNLSSGLVESWTIQGGSVVGATVFGPA